VHRGQRQSSPSAAESKASTTLFQNVRIFNGRDAALSAPSNVLVRGNVIERISTGAIEPGPSTTIVAGGSRTLMPGLIDAHWHSLYAGTGFVTALTADLGYLNLAASKAAEATLMSGFTTVRDMGGPAFGLKRAIDEELLRAPESFLRVQ
jgi:imidazolonepropionase-like amidohydrolase